MHVLDALRPSMNQAAFMMHSSDHTRHQLGLLKLCLLVSCSLFATLYSVFKVIVRGVSPISLLVESVVSARQFDAKDNDLLQAST